MPIFIVYGYHCYEKIVLNVYNDSLQIYQNNIFLYINILSTSSSFFQMFHFRRL